MSSDLVKVQTDRGEVRLSIAICRKALFQKSRVEDHEWYLFIQHCKYLRLNPFLKEIMLVKYSEKQPASIVIGKHIYMSAVSKHPKYRGIQSGLVNGTWDRDNLSNNRAYCEIEMDGYKKPVRYEVSYDEAVQTDYEGKPNHTWKKMPEHMLIATAERRCARKAMPDSLGGLYAEDEMPESDGLGDVVDGEVIDDTPTIAVKEPAKTITEGQVKLINARLTQHSVDRIAFKREFNIEHIKELTMGQMDKALTFITNYKPEPQPEPEIKF